MNMSYMSILIFSAHAAEDTICLCVIFAITCCPLSGDLWRKCRSCGVRMMLPTCDRPFLAFFRPVLHVGLSCSLPVFRAVSRLFLLLGLLWPVMVAVSTAGTGDDVARDMLCSERGEILTAVRARLFLS